VEFDKTVAFEIIFQGFETQKKNTLHIYSKLTRISPNPRE